ncbi:hypothetical protein BVC80_5g37 [Macleaya cordata]|uniref:Uncharacterized protein n=1 Tax=Macleaya cordata TaxID=56857 RepID=A0A200QXP2_MACCD|nr:hypothetical protein BVC80_5g37 [Macleaya cordata]
MKEVGSVPPSATTASNDGSNMKEEDQLSTKSRIREGWISLTTSVQEGLGYGKAFFVGQTKKLMARNEKEASEADLQAAKMEVDATNAAEDTKKRFK